MHNHAAIKKGPVVCLHNSKKMRYQALKDYYEAKIKTLIEMKLPPKLVLLACWDAPVEREDLTKPRNRAKFIKKCLKYYKAQLKNIEKLQKSL